MDTIRSEGSRRKCYDAGARSDARASEGVMGMPPRHRCMRKEGARNSWSRQGCEAARRRRLRQGRKQDVDTPAGDMTGRRWHAFREKALAAGGACEGLPGRALGCTPTAYAAYVARSGRQQAVRGAFVRAAYKMWCRYWRMARCETPLPFGVATRTLPVTDRSPRARLAPSAKSGSRTLAIAASQRLRRE